MKVTMEQIANTVGVSRGTVDRALHGRKGVNPQIAELERTGVATVTAHADGSKTVAYRGTDRGQYLRRSDLQVCACRVLEQLAKL